MRKSDGRAEIDAVPLIRSFTLHAEAVAATDGRGTQKHGHFRLRRGGIDGRPAWRAEIELLVKILLLQKWQEQRPPGEATRPIAVLGAVGDAERRTIHGRVRRDVGRRK